MVIHYKQKYRELSKKIFGGGKKTIRDKKMYNKLNEWILKSDMEEYIKKYES